MNALVDVVQASLQMSLEATCIPIAAKDVLVETSLVMLVISILVQL